MELRPGDVLRMYPNHPDDDGVSIDYALVEVVYFVMDQDDPDNAWTATRSELEQQIKEWGKVEIIRERKRRAA